MKNLIKRAQRGDADAFTELMQLQLQNLYKAARAILRNDEDAADAVADTLFVCWEKIGQLQKAEFFCTWMTRILINKCNDVLRKKKELYYGNNMQEPCEETQGYNNAEWLEVINCLDEKYRLIMVLHYVNGLTAAQIGEVLGMPASTVRTRLARGREQITSIYRADEKQYADRKTARGTLGGGTWEKARTDKAET